LSNYLFFPTCLKFDRIVLNEVHLDETGRKIPEWKELLGRNSSRNHFEKKTIRVEILFWKCLLSQKTERLSLKYGDESYLKIKSMGSQPHVNKQISKSASDISKFLVEIRDQIPQNFKNTPLPFQTSKFV
jgi:hypothetical protein